MRLTNGTLIAGLASALMTLVGGCASSADQIDDEPLTADNIQERVSEAMRDAGTFSFEWEGSIAGEDETQMWTGKVKYGDDGDLEALSLSRQDGEEHRFVDDTLYVNGSGDDEWNEVDGEDRSELLLSWDWATVIEDLKSVENLSDEGKQEVNGVDTTEYQFETEATTLTWWVDDEDRVVKWKDETAVGTLTDFGEPVDIRPPE